MRVLGVIIALLSCPAWAGGQGNLTLSGYVPAALDVRIEAVQDGIRLRNRGNHLVFFQAGSRHRPGRRIAQLEQQEVTLLRTEVWERKDQGVFEIRILAP